MPPPRAQQQQGRGKAGGAAPAAGNAPEARLCPYCGKEVDAECDDCNEVSCNRECHAPLPHDLIHERCLKQLLRGMAGKNYDPSRKSGFPCPRGASKAGVLAPCPGKIIHSQKHVIKAKSSAQADQPAPAPAPGRAPAPAAARAPAAAAAKAPAAKAAPRAQPARPASPALPVPGAGVRPAFAWPATPLVHQPLLAPAGRIAAAVPAPEAAAAAEPRADPLGRNAAAAAAAAAKSAKKNAKRAAAKQQRREAEAGGTGSGPQSTADAEEQLSEQGSVVDNGSAFGLCLLASDGGDERLNLSSEEEDGDGASGRWAGGGGPAGAAEAYALAASGSGGGGAGAAGSGDRLVWSQGVAAPVEPLSVAEAATASLPVVLPVFVPLAQPQQPTELPAAQPLQLAPVVPSWQPQTTAYAAPAVNPIAVPPAPSAEEDATDEELLALLLSG